MTTFTHLHLHSQYSLLDGAILIPDLVEYCKETGMESCAITDHGWMAGVVDFYKQCKKNNIKPLLGSEVYCTDDKDNKFNQDKTKDNMHMILIAKDNIGYSRLLEIVSNAALNNFYYKPRVYREHLRSLGGHVVATSACLGGILSKKLTWEIGEDGKAIACTDPDGVLDREINFYKNIFGNDFYLELQVWNDRRNYQQIYNQWLLKFGKKHNLPFVITADCHYLRKKDFNLHELLMAMQMKKTLDEYREGESVMTGPHFYVASPEEMLKRAQSLSCEEAYYNTGKIAKQCNVEIQLGVYQEPIFNIEDTEDYQDFLLYKQGLKNNG